MSIRHLVAAFAAAVSFSVFATETPQKLDDLVVTPTRSAQSENTTAHGLVVITRQDIQRSGASVIADVLRARAGVEVIDTFGDGSRTLVGLRGFGENAHSNTLILVDGRRLNNPDIGAPDLNSISLDRVARIEILTGSAGALYGDQAVGGVINIITTGERSRGFRAELSGGSYHTGGIRAGIGGAPDASSNFQLDVSGLTRDNYRDNNELKQVNATGRANFTGDNNRAFLEYQRYEERLQTPAALFAAEVAADRRQSAADFKGDFTDTDTDALRLGFGQELGTAWTFDTEASFRHTDGVFRTGFRGSPATSDATQQRRIAGLTPKLRYEFAGPAALPAQLVVGSDLLFSDYRLSTSFGPQQNDQRTADGYLQLNLPITDSVGTTSAFRYGSVRNQLRDGGAFPFFPAGQPIRDDQLAHSFGVHAQVDPALRVFARYDHGFRFAKVDEYFGAGAAAAALNLKTQTGNSFETGADWNDGGFSVSAQAYRLYLDKELAFDPTTFSNFNLPETRRDGQLLEARYQLNDAFSVLTSYTHIEATIKSGAFSGKRVPLSAEHVGRLALDYSPLGIWRVLLEMQATDDRVFSGDFDNSLKPLSGYAVLNLVTELRLAGGYANLRLNNILDKEYSEFGSSGFNPFPTEVPSFFPSPEFNAMLRIGIEY